MSAIQDGPQTSLFTPLNIRGNKAFSDLLDCDLSDEMKAGLAHAPQGDCVAWGLPFAIGDVIVLRDGDFSIDLDPIKSRWLAFLHTSDFRPVEPNQSGYFSPMRGEGQLAEHAANYIICYQAGDEVSVPIRRRFQLGTFQRHWGENCFEAVAHHKPRPIRAAHEQLAPSWGWTQTRVDVTDSGSWTNWLWAWENPYP